MEIIVTLKKCLNRSIDCITNKRLIQRMKNYGVYDVYYSHNNYLAKIYFDDLTQKSEAFISELEKYIELLSNVSHRAVAKLEGYSLVDFNNDPHLVIFYDYNYSTLKNKYKRDLKSSEKIINIYGIASGMKYLHENNIIHGKLSPTNIFEDYDRYPLISDFSIFDFTENKKKEIDYLNKFVFTSPEVLRGENLSKENDVYSFAMITYMIITKNLPFEELNPFEIITKIINGERPQIPPETPDCYRQLIEKCWDHNPKNRPSFEDICRIIEDDSDFINSISANVQYFKSYKLNKPKPKPMKKIKPKLKPVIENETENKPLENEPDDYERGKYPRDAISDLPLEFDVNMVKASEFEQKAKIGEGSFGKIYKVIEKKTGNLYAAKISRIIIDTRTNNVEGDRLENEIIITAKLNHPSIIKFIGFSSTNFKDETKPIIITEFAANGSLDKILEMESNSLSSKNWNNTKKLINLYGIASAMSYLHNLNILHLDIKTSNILVDINFCPKIADFGMSKDMSDEENKESFKDKEFKGSPAYMAPEIWKEMVYSKPVDVYAFGVTAYEIITNEKPFDDIKNAIILAFEVLNLKRRPEFKFPIPPCYKKLIEDCWNDNPNKRPTFDQIVQELKNNHDFIDSFSVDEDEFIEFTDMIDKIYSVKPKKMKKTVSKSVSSLKRKTKKSNDKNDKYKVKEDEKVLEDE